MMASYRDPRYAASLRVEQLRDRFVEHADIPEPILRIEARRTGRAWAGAAAAFGFVAMVVALLGRVVQLRDGRPLLFGPTLVLPAALLLSLVAYVAGRAHARRTLAARLWDNLDGSTDVLALAARLEAGAVRRAAAHEVSKAEESSLMLPMVGLSLLAPLSIHLLVWILLRIGSGSFRLREDLTRFDAWIGVSLCLVGIAHLALAVLSAHFAKKVAEAPLWQLARESPVSGWSVYGWTIAASCFPGLLVFVIPPILVAITGLLFIPWMCRAMYRRALEERLVLGDF